MTIKTFERINPDAKNFTGFTPGQLVSDLINGDMYELVDFVDECVTFSFNINSFFIHICMDMKDAGIYRDIIKSALENKNYHWLVLFVSDYVNEYGDVFCSSIQLACKEKGKRKVLHYETVEEIQEALHLLFMALEDMKKEEF